MTFVTSRSKCFPKSATAHYGKSTIDAPSNQNSILSNIQQQPIRTTYATNNCPFKQINLTKTDCLLSQTSNLILQPFIKTSTQSWNMPKMMDSFSTVCQPQTSWSPTMGTTGEGLLNTPVAEMLTPEHNLHTSTENEKYTFLNTPDTSMFVNDIDCLDSDSINQQCFTELKYITNETSPHSSSYLNSPPLSVESIPIDQQYDNEQSYNFNGDYILPLPNSQDYDENFTLADEVEQICNINYDYDKHNNNDSDLPKTEYETLIFESENNIILMDDPMLTESMKISINYDEDTLSQKCNNVVEMTELRIPVGECLVKTSNLMLNSNKVDENSSSQQNVEHNYSNTNKINQNTNSNNINIAVNNTSSLPVMAKRASARQMAKRKRLPLLKIKINTCNGNATMVNNDNYDVKSVVSTPELTNAILEMEEEKFDLIRYIDSTEELPRAQTPETKMIIDNYNVENCENKFKDIFTMIPTPAPTPIKRSRQSSYDSPNSVQSMTSTNASDDSFASTSTNVTPVKRRGRPPKTGPTVLSPSQFKHLSEVDRKYIEMRNKNNEASRLSRLNRKGKETEIMKAARILEETHSRLEKQEKEVDKEIEKWRKFLLRLAEL